MDDKITQALDILYQGAEEKKQKLNYIIKGLSSAAKEKLYIALYDKIESSKKNFEKFHLKMRLIDNKIGDQKDSLEAEKIDFNI